MATHSSILACKISWIEEPVALQSMGLQRVGHDWATQLNWIFHCVYVPQLSYPFVCWWTSRLLPCPGYYKQCCNKHWGTCVSFNSVDLKWRCQAPLTMGFSRQEYWSGCHSLIQGMILTQGLKIWVSCIAGRFFTAQPQGKPFAPNTSLQNGKDCFFKLWPKYTRPIDN